MLLFPLATMTVAMRMYHAATEPHISSIESCEKTCLLGPISIKGIQMQTNVTIITNCIHNITVIFVSKSITFLK